MTVYYRINNDCNPFSKNVCTFEQRFTRDEVAEMLRWITKIHSANRFALNAYYEFDVDEDKYDTDKYDRVIVQMFWVEELTGKHKIDFNKFSYPKGGGYHDIDVLSLDDAIALIPEDGAVSFVPNRSGYCFEDEVEPDWIRED